MEKLLHFDSPSEVYTADACVIGCIDARFDAAIRKLLKRRGVLLYDYVRIPGSAKPLAAPEDPAERDFLLRAVRTSMRLHRVTRVLLIGHNDCGAYPGAPADEITRDLARAAELLREEEPSLLVECYFADFDGIYRLGVTSRAGATGLPGGAA
ncbi:MAG TPA: carbonic anhydrase [Bryobacteraceae bacterium]